MGGYIGIILVTMSVLRPGDCDACGRLYFNESRVNEGETALLIYLHLGAKEPPLWHKVELNNLPVLLLNTTSRSSLKYEESRTDDRFILRIIETKTADSGKYYVHCRSNWSKYALLDVIERTQPSDPEFEDVEDMYNCSKCLPARLNIPMNVTCFVKGGSKPVELKIFKSEELLSTVQREDVNSKTITVTYVFKPTSDNFDTDFKCTVKYPVLHVKKNVTTKLYIKVDPESIEIKTQQTKENERSKLQCKTINGRPPTRSFIYFKNKLHNNSVKTETIPSGYKYNVTTTLWRRFTRQDNQASVRCCIDRSTDVCSNKEYLNVIFSPESVELLELKRESTENGNTVLVLKCDVDESNPKSFVDWKEVRSLTKKLVEEKYINDTATHGWKFVSSWMFNLTKKDRDRKITCEVKNPAFPDLELHKSYMANITYSPVITLSENGIKTVYIGDNVMFSCYVDSNPPPVITWSSKNITLKETSGKNRLDLHLVNVTFEHSHTYTCMARNGIGGWKSRDITLSLKVPSDKKYYQPSSEANSVSFFGPIVGGAVVIAVVAVAVFLLLRKKRNDAAPKRERTYPIKDEPRHESVHPARNVPLHNDIPASNEKDVENAPEYACVIPKAKRKHGKDQLKSEDAPEYAGVIPKAKRKSEPGQLKSEDAPEYAGVIPKAKRKSEPDQRKSEDAPEFVCVIPKTERKHDTDQRKSEDASPKSQGDTLLYAELDLNFHSETTARRPLTKQYEPTEYVTIDFSKTGTVKIEKEEIETGAAKTVHDEMATASVKKEAKDI